MASRPTGLYIDWAADPFCMTVIDPYWGPINVPAYEALGLWSTDCTWQQVERYTRDLAACPLYTEEDLATTGETRPEEIERGEREKKRREKKTWSEGGKTAGRWIAIFYHLDIFFFL
ncbi:hypothetical protein TNIN_63081 [Trichonephila inaurata madagascariensis]|uniref:Uncharacterized protein n=1 Tax=Trichonephila inaurata madagascariensis TaxID=2747483 RepID=A0A8X6YA87_9ARAC|nr:hypothetical protein TNIN_63081 [Trichonephila inaurata madagascariensis]